MRPKPQISRRLSSWLYLCVGLFLGEVSQVARGADAVLHGYCFSIPLGVGSATLGGNSLKSYFTTYDGSSGLPLHDVVNGGWVLSSELSLVPGNAGSYRSDYVPAINGTVNSTGTVAATFPTTDADGNGTPRFPMLRNF